MTDLTPVALTSILCKKERELTIMVNENLDPLQFAGGGNGESTTPG